LVDLDGEAIVATNFAKWMFSNYGKLNYISYYVPRGSSKYNNLQRFY